MDSIRLGEKAVYGGIVIGIVGGRRRGRWRRRRVARPRFLGLKILPSTLVNRTPVSDARHFHFLDLVIDGVDHAVIADADAPHVSSADEFLASVGSGVNAQRLDF